MKLFVGIGVAPLTKTNMNLGTQLVSKVIPVERRRPRSLGFTLKTNRLYQQGSVYWRNFKFAFTDKYTFKAHNKKHFYCMSAINDHLIFNASSINSFLLIDII